MQSASAPIGVSANAQTKAPHSGSSGRSRSRWYSGSSTREIGDDDASVAAAGDATDGARRTGRGAGAVAGARVAGCGARGGCAGGGAGGAALVGVDGAAANAAAGAAAGAGAIAELRAELSVEYSSTCRVVLMATTGCGASSVLAAWSSSTSSGVDASDAVVSTLLR